MHQIQKDHSFENNNNNHNGSVHLSGNAFGGGVESNEVNKASENVYQFHSLSRELFTSTLNRSDSKLAASNNSALLLTPNIEMDWNVEAAFQTGYPDLDELVNRINTTTTTSCHSHNAKSDVNVNAENNYNQHHHHQYMNNINSNLTFNFEVSNDAQQQIQQSGSNGGDFYTTNQSHLVDSGGWQVKETTIENSDPLIGRSAFIVDNSSNASSDPNGFTVPWELLAPEYNRITNSYF